MPLMIVYASSGLGGIIITEATPGFLGLGIKYPLHPGVVLSTLHQTHSL